MHVRLRGINTIRRRLSSGAVETYYYHKASKRRLRGAPGTPEFIASIAEAEGAVIVQRTGPTVSLLIRQFCDSPEWRALADSTRSIMVLNLKAVEDKWGTVPLVVASDPQFRADVLDWRDALAKTHPRAADAKVSAFARVLSWGLDRRKVRGNPLVGVKQVWKGSRADKLWLPEHVRAFEAVAGADVWRALMLGLHTGQREGDLLRLTWSAYDGHALTVTQGKSGGKVTVWVPCTAALKAVLDAMPRQADTILTHGEVPWTKRAFAYAWNKASAAAGTSDLHFHDLRGTAVTMLAEAGCTVPEIASITGHTLASVNKILEVYLSRTKALAASAIGKLEAHRPGEIRQNAQQNDPDVLVCSQGGKGKKCNEIKVVRPRGLEPPRVSPLAPQAVLSD